MSSQQEKILFSERLKQALKDAQHPISPTYLSTEFNHRYDGQAISVQSANNWLLGKAIPSQDKLSILAIWLGVSNQWLRFGDQENIMFNELSTDQQDIDYFLKYKRLTTTQKKLIHDLINQLI